MPQRIEVPGQGIVEFPDGMSDGEIVSAIQELSGEAKAPSQKSAPTWMEKVAANPATRFAVGAAEPYQGFTQRASEAKVPGLSIPALLSAAAKISRPGTDEAFADVKSMAKAGGAEGYDVAGLLGNIASPASLAMGKVPIPTSRMGKVGLGAGAGAAGGALAPADTEAQARVNALIGAGAGGVLTPVIHGGGKAAEWAANTVGRPIADLFTKSGPMNIAKKYIRSDKVVGENNLPAVLSAARNAQEMA